ncbi:MAG: molybdopterin-dependent oxidoreductase [Acidobacteria bacterium]|nr:molybdopterin-dependent oxidoreductase [Acidobacteriota bacterium]
MTDEMQSARSSVLRSGQRQVATTCVLDCPDSCALSVTVEPGPQGDRVLNISGGQDHPTTAGFICHKVANFDRRLDHESRILSPMRRRGPKGSGEFETISWEDALAEVAGRLQEIRQRWGGEAILPCHYGGSNGAKEEDFLDQVFFARLGASRPAKTLCAIPTGTVYREMYGRIPGVAYGDYEAARFILIWGCNPKTSGIHLIPFLRRARQAGAYIAVVDPLKNFSDREVDLHLPVFPGTDLPVALSMVRHFREQGLLAEGFLEKHAVGLGQLLEAAEAWTLDRAADAARVPAELIRELAERFATTSPAVVRCGWGVERNRNGGDAVAAILALPALLGKFGVRGGGYTMSNSGAARSAGADVLHPPRWQTRILNMTCLGEQLTTELEPPVKALFVYNCNPVATIPDQSRILAGLEREDLFTVVSEQVMTDTALYADVLLPAATFLEVRDFRVGYGSLMVGGVQPAVAPRGEALPNSAMFAALGRAMGFEDEAFFLSQDELFDRLADSLEITGGPVDVARLRAGGVQRYDFPGEGPVLMKTLWPATRDGKIHLTPPSLGKAPFEFQPLSSDYPLALLSPASSRLLNSQFGESNVDELAVTLHPEDAAQREIAGGDEVRVWNDLGEVRCRARLSDRARPGVAFMPKGAWRRSSANGRTSTTLCPATTQKVGGGACYSDARVEVEKLVATG